MPETETALSRGIGLTNLMYTQYLNRKLKQSGHIWQNRFFSCVVENDRYLWSVARYIERNPLKVALAASAELYRWSSAKAHITGTNDPLLDATSWLSLEERGAYRCLSTAEVSGGTTGRIEESQLDEIGRVGVRARFQPDSWTPPGRSIPYPLGHKEMI
ncbi:MAG: hypothetical protein PHC49_05605 [Desulfuromonadaceae bacterium]|nr:hypothetical protein [Desulfuromonadaceae bacterium]